MGKAGEGGGAVKAGQVFFLDFITIFWCLEKIWKFALI